ncbi:MAG: hypothetical protein II414_08725, partial [Erysipelotrichaceae bacterium]|nr:hypothetical protein [Erysipelotrichaceae bacterium]
MTKKITDNQAFTGQLLSYNYYPDKKYLPSSAFRAVEYLDDGNIKIRIGDLEIATMPAELFSCFGLQ